MSRVSPVLPALFQGWTAGAVLYMFVMSGKAWPGAMPFTREISIPRPGSISFKKETLELQ